MALAVIVFVHHILQGLDMVICDQENVVLIPHLIEALGNKWDEVIRHTGKWLIEDMRRFS